MNQDNFYAFCTQHQSFGECSHLWDMYGTNGSDLLMVGILLGIAIGLAVAGIVAALQ